MQQRSVYLKPKTKKAKIIPSNPFNQPNLQQNAQPENSIRRTLEPILSRPKQRPPNMAHSPLVPIGNLY